MATKSGYLTTSATVNYAQSDITHVLEMDDILDPDLYTAGTVRVRQYNVFAGMFAQATLIRQTTNGVIAEGMETRIKEVVGTAVFTGQNQVKLPYPVYASFRVSVIGLYFDAKGKRISPTPTFLLDAETGNIVTSAACYGAINYSYQASYNILRYTPSEYMNEEARFVWGAADYGMIVAFYLLSAAYTTTHSASNQLSVITFQVQAPEGLNLEEELYRIESTIIVTQTGAWERPPGFPTQGWYTQAMPADQEAIDQMVSDQRGIDINAPYLEVKKVYEIAHFTLQQFSGQNDRSQSRAYTDVPMSTKGLGQDTSEVINSIIAPLNELRQEQFAQTLPDYRIPRMRITKYEQPLQKPYDGRKWLTIHRHVVYDPLRPPSNEERWAQTQHERNLEDDNYKIVLAINKGREPTAGNNEIRTGANQHDVTKGTQEAIINATLYRAWRGIDWETLKRRIDGAYPDTWFTKEYFGQWKNI